MARQSAEYQMRMRIAQEAARLIAEEGQKDFGLAKRKAAQRLGVADTRNLPRNQEIEAALEAYQRLFQADSQPQQLTQLRRAALDAMRFFAQFRPKLVGPVLKGTAGEYSEINLHVFADTPKDVTFYLMESKIPFDTADRRFRFEREQWIELPAYRFMAGEYPVELVVFPRDGRREAPSSPIDGRPMMRASVSAVEALLGEAEAQANSL